ncbi:MAG: DNA (cytosine-5-)-methyltransferase [Caldilineaceae bacterium]
MGTTTLFIMTMLQMNLFPDVTDDTSDLQPREWFSSALTTLDIVETGGWPDTFGDALRRWHGAKAKPEITAISLFSGGGGLDIGFHDAGFKIIECNEIEPAFAATLQRNTFIGGKLEGSKIICQDIHQYTPSIKHVDFIIGGPPCQTFSAAGARAAGVNGTDDERGNLFLQYARLLELLQPAGFLFENVYRIVGAQSGRAWKQIQAVFQSLGYKLYWRILDAADYGVPQFRERLIIVGLKAGTYLFPFPSHGPDSPDNHEYYSAGQAVSDIDTSHCKIGIGGRHGHLLNDIPPGLNYSFYTERMGHPKPIFGWRSKFSDYLYKADPNTPVRTIKAQGGQYTGPFSWENRSFAIEELKRLQTFPDKYIIEGNRQTVIHQLGNSVPPQLARVLALSILDQVFGIRLPFNVSRMPEDYELGFRQRKSELTNIYAEKAAHALANPATQSTNAYPLNQSGTEFYSLTNDLRILTNLSKETAEYVGEFRLTASEWIIQVSDVTSTSDKNCYEIDIQPPSKGSAKEHKQATIKLISRSTKPTALLALWKVYERFVRQHLFKDDLIQLFGYYQSKVAYSIKMTFLDKALSSIPFWQTVKMVTSGYGVGAIMPASELTTLYALASDEELLSCLTALKELGYEIRSHRTNRQIRNGMILIPYSFPTLNERSLQRLTRL